MQCQWEVNRKSSLNHSRVGFVKQISSFLKTVLQDSAVTYSHPSFSGTERETPLQMEISFISVNVPQKNNFYSVFRVSPVSISQKQNQRTTIFLPESPILEWYIVLHFQSILFLYFWNVLKNLQEIKHKTKQTKKHYRKHREAEKHRAVSRKAAPPGSEPQWRLWEERTEHRTRV